MGGQRSKHFQNYTFPFRPESTFSVIAITEMTEQPHLSEHRLPPQFEVPAYGLKSKSQLPADYFARVKIPLPSSLTLLTYNVWFESHNNQNRYPCILQLLRDSDADVICLQEVNLSFLNLLHQYGAELGGKKHEYYMQVSKMHWYDTVILSKYPCRFYKKLFEQSQMGRCLLTAVITLQGETNQYLGVHCVHLESLNNIPERMRQLKDVNKISSNLDISIVAGDFNFSDGGQQNEELEIYTDVWKTGRIHPSLSKDQTKHTGFTMLETNNFAAWRPDHIMIHRNKGNQLKGEHEIAVIGDFSLEPQHNSSIYDVKEDGIVRTPSDHFGLFAKISLE